MYLERLSLINYRNYESVNQSFSQKFNILIGMNAQGKTNLIEAIYYLSTGQSYRPARDLQLIKWNGNFFKISGFVVNKERKLHLEVRYKNTFQADKEIKINGVKKNKTFDLLGNFNSVLFAPEDLNIIKGSPAERRKIIDIDIAQVSPSYYLTMHKFSRILKQRNSILRKIMFKRGTIEELNVWDTQFIEISKEVIIRRLQALERLTPLTRLMQRKLTAGQENLEIKYLLNKKTEVKYSDDTSILLHTELRKHREEEIARGITLWGPHRDDFSILLNGFDLKYYGSQGQHRTAVLALKLAELEFFKSETGEYPVLLLDDVLSELDEKRREHLINTIKSRDIQCFITTTEDILEKLQITEVKKMSIVNGKIDVS